MSRVNSFGISFLVYLTGSKKLKKNRKFNFISKLKRNKTVGPFELESNATIPVLKQHKKCDKLK